MSFQNVQLIKIGATQAEYQPQKYPRGHRERKMSTTEIKIVGDCPDKYISGYEAPQTKAKNWGSVIDCVTTNPVEFNNRYAVCPETYPAPKTHAKVKKGTIKEGDPLPWNANASVCKEWEEMAEESGKEVISAKTYSEANKAVSRLLADEEIRDWYAQTDKQCWLEGFWLDEATCLVIPVRCLIDFVGRLDGRFPKNLGDLKCVRSAKPEAFEIQLDQMGWDIQAAFNLDMWRAAFPKEDRVNFCFITQENYAPYHLEYGTLSEESLQNGRDKYRAALKNYAQCLKFNKWPGYKQDKWHIYNPRPYMIRQLEAYQFTNEAPQEEQDEVGIIP